ncbi:MAG: type II toxin-antitoxin system VapC family toxin [Coriobacteriales bacterium]|jgi:predicted nucleic-acid-binding protein|nr:type II toxin-antitoxin system VapC family toxin [Coriobacteriales bacterium]
MTGIDTNVLVRYLTQDDKEQASLANELFASASASKRLYISTFVLLETIWVLRSVYETDFITLGESLCKLCASPRICVQDSKVVEAVLKDGIDKDYMDAFVVKAAELAGCDSFFTFDTRLATKHRAATLLKRC